MAEQIDLNTPLDVRPGVTRLRVAQLVFNIEQQYIEVLLLGEDGRRRLVHVPAAENVLKALNTANLSTKSLQRRVMEFVAGQYPEYAGVVSGQPD